MRQHAGPRVGLEDLLGLAAAVQAQASGRKAARQLDAGLVLAGRGPWQQLAVAPDQVHAFRGALDEFIEIAAEGAVAKLLQNSRRRPPPTMVPVAELDAARPAQHPFGEHVVAQHAEEPQPQAQHVAIDKVRPPDLGQADHVAGAVGQPGLAFLDARMHLVRRQRGQRAGLAELVRLAQQRRRPARGQRPG